MRRVSSPGYWKDSVAKQRRLILLVRRDRYVVDEQRRVIILKDFKMAIRFVGRLRWFGRQGRLGMHYDDARNAWYACIPVEVGVEEAKTGRRSRHIVKGERRVIQIATPKGSRVASIDLGINNLASVVVDDGTWLLYKGVRAKEDYFYLQRLISRIQSLRDTLKDKLLADAIEELNREVRRLHGKLKRRLLHLYRNFASHLLKQLHELGISTISGLPLQYHSTEGQ
jgi:putative transposase